MAEAMTPITPARPMVLDALMPAFDATRIEHRVSDGDQARVYDAVTAADFIRAWRDNPAVRALFAARSTAEQIMTRVRGHEAGASPPAPESMRLADLPTHGQWVRLGEDPPHEIAFGVVGRFWAGETTWEEIDAEEFGGFSRPDFARIACNFSLRPYGAARTLVSYEARTRATDERARRAFLRYWRAASTGAGVVMRSQLAIVAREAAAPAGD
jgi:hypothetical protein